MWSASKLANPLAKCVYPDAYLMLFKICSIDAYISFHWCFVSYRYSPSIKQKSQSSLMQNPARRPYQQSHRRNKFIPIHSEAQVTLYAWQFSLEKIQDSTSPSTRIEILIPMENFLNPWQFQSLFDTPNTIFGHGMTIFDSLVNDNHSYFDTNPLRCPFRD